MADLLKMPEACNLLGIGPVTLWRWGKTDHRLRPIKVGPRAARYSREAIASYINERKEISQ